MLGYHTWFPQWTMHQPPGTGRPEGGARSRRCPVGHRQLPLPGGEQYFSRSIGGVVLQERLVPASLETRLHRVVSTPFGSADDSHGRHETRLSSPVPVYPMPQDSGHKHINRPTAVVRVYLDPSPLVPERRRRPAADADDVLTPICQPQHHSAIPWPRTTICDREAAVLLPLNRLHGIRDSRHDSPGARGFVDVDVRDPASSRSIPGTASEPAPKHASGIRPPGLGI